MAIDLADLGNALFEVVGGVLIILHTGRAWRDRVIKGVHWAPFVFFWAWGGWNLFYYAHVGQPLSAAAAFMPFIANSSYLLSWWLLQPPRMSFRPSQAFAPVEAYAYVPATVIEAARVWLRRHAERVADRLLSKM